MWLHIWVEMKGNNKTCILSNNSNVFFSKGCMKNLWKTNLHKIIKWNHILLQIHCSVFCLSFFFLPTKAKWHLIAIANIHQCDYEYKWDCWASCSHGNTSGTWYADWPWGVEFTFPHEFSSKVSLWLSAWGTFFLFVKATCLMLLLVLACFLWLLVYVKQPWQFEWWGNRSIRKTKNCIYFSR